MGQQIFCVSPTLVFFAYQVISWHFYIVEENLVHFMFAIQQDDGTNLYARGFHID